MFTKNAKKRWSTAASILLGLSAAGPSSSALAVSVDNTRVKGEGADAYWSDYTPDGCGYSYTSISASETLTTGGSASSYAYVNTGKYNWCTGEYVWLSGYASPVQLSGQKVSKATLQAVIPLSGDAWDPSMSCGSSYCPINHTATVKINWIGNNDATRGTTSNRNQTPTGFYSYRYTGTQATATASGSITFEDGTGPTLGSSLGADIYNTTDGSISVSHP